LQTLKNTNKDVTALKEDLKIKMIDVNAKKADCDVFLEKMGEQRAIAEGEQDAAKVVQGRADAAAQDARKIEESAASDLAVAQPALDAAKDAVNCLDKASVTELKSFAKPPSGVDKVTDALLILVKGAGKKGLGWDPAKKMMAKVCISASCRVEAPSLHLTMPGVVFLSNLSWFGPRRATTMLRA